MTPFLAVFLPLAIAYATALRWCYDLWNIEGSDFAHGPLVPLLMGTMFWLRRRQWQARPGGFDRGGYFLLGPALLMHLVGAALMIDSLSAASLALAVPGAAWLAVGRERLRGQWPVLWLFAFAVPLPIYVNQELAFTLKEIAVRGGAWLATASGLSVTRVAAELYVPGQTEPLIVAAPCGGLRSLLAMVTVAYFVAFFVGPPRFWRRCLLLAAAAPVAVFVNLLRIGAICWLANWFGVEFASGLGHDLLNGGAWIVDLLIIVAFDRVLSRSRAAQPVPEAAVRPMQPLRHGHRRPWLPWLACAPLLVLSLYRPNAETSGRADAMPATVGPFTQSFTYPMASEYYHLLGTRDATWRRYDDTDGSPCFVVAVFHDANWKSVHPPHICLRGSDMDVLEDGEVPFGEDGETIGRILLRGTANGRPYLSLYAYGARSLCTGSYARFFLHHAPRALFRASNAGFLLRVESYADGEDGLVGAEQRCRELLTGLLHEARGLLP